MPAAETGEYMQQERRGFSTMTLDLRLVAQAKAGDRIDVRTSIAHLGNTSLSYIHRMHHADGREIAYVLQVGVQLDLDAAPDGDPAGNKGAIAKLLSKA